MKRIGLTLGERAFLLGFGSAIDLWGVSLPSPRQGGFQEDAAAIAGDWRAVGDDLRAVLRGDPETRRAAQDAEAR